MTATQTETGHPEPKYTGAFDLVGPSFKIFKDNLVTFLILGLAPVVLGIIFKIFFVLEWSLPRLPETQEQFADFGKFLSSAPSTFWISLAIAIICLISLSMIFATGLLYFVFQTVRGKKSGLAESLKAGWKFFWRILLFWFTVGLILLPAYLALIIPGLVLTILWLPRLCIGSFVIIDEKLGPWATFKRAGEIAAVGKLWDVIGVLFIVAILNNMVVSIFPTFLGSNWISDILISLTSSIFNMIFMAVSALRYVQIRQYMKQLEP